jgi:hypothetical protein
MGSGGKGAVGSSFLELRCTNAPVHRSKQQRLRFVENGANPVRPGGEQLPAGHAGSTRGRALCEPSVCTRPAESVDKTMNKCVQLEQASDGLRVHASSGTPVWQRTAGEAGHLGDLILRHLEPVA